MPTPLDRETLRAKAKSFGFDAVRFTAAKTAETTRDRFREFLNSGYAGDMGWLVANADRREDVRVLWPEARTAIMVALNYGPDSDPRALNGRPDVGAVSVYARNRDYHDTLKKRLKAFAGWLADTRKVEVKIFVDTAPLLEKPLAHQAGLGWQGKHTNLVSREYGSWLFLGEVLTTLEIAPDPSEDDHCGACTNCLDVCPTDAFVGPYKLDARKCISYLTIEHKGHIAAELRALIGNRIYGCDDCLAVCPWNKFARVAAEPDFKSRAALEEPLLDDLAKLDDASFRAMFSGSPIKRIGRDRFVRNVLIAIGNSRDAALGNAAVNLLGDPSPLVRAAAVWACSRLREAHDFAALRREHEPAETDPAVRGEWAR